MIADINRYPPVVILPGYSGPQLFLDAGLPTEQQIWAPRVNGVALRSVADVLLTTLPRLLADAGGNADAVVEKFGELVPVLEKLGMNDDGSSRYNVRALPRHARNSRWDVMLSRGQARLNIAQRPTTNSLLDFVPADQIYFFASDWRLGQVDGSKELHAFIQEVKADAGCEKVSLLAVSYGGQLAAAYFAFYGGAEIDRAVLHAPAIRGSALTADMLEKPGLAFDHVPLLDLAAVFMQRELSLSQRLKRARRAEVFSEIATRVIRTHALPPLRRFGSFWDIVPPGDYERLKALYLDPVKNAEIIRKSDIVHREMMPDIGETLRRMQKEGVKLAVIAGTGLPLVGGSPVDSDSIVDTASATGAFALPLTAEPPAARRHGPHVSPDGRIDAAGAYLPDHTWFFRGQYHGQAAWDRCARQLYCKWLFTDDIQDIYSDPAFPQFRDSCNPSDGLELRFSHSVTGFLTAGDTSLLLTNLSRYDIGLVSVQAEGLALHVPIGGRLTLRPGETARLPFESALPDRARRFSLTVAFVRRTAVPAREHRTFPFTALPAGGEVPQALRFPCDAPAEAHSDGHRHIFAKNTFVRLKMKRP